MIFEREGGRYRMSMDRREALDLISKLSESLKNGIGAYPITTISVPMIEVEKEGKKNRGYSKVLLITTDPKLYEVRVPVGTNDIKPDRRHRGDPR